MSSIARFFQQPRFFTLVLALSGGLSVIESLALFAVFWWKRSNEVGRSSAHQIGLVKRESRIIGPIDGLDHSRSSTALLSTPALHHPETDVERLEGLEEMDSNNYPNSSSVSNDDYHPRNSDLSLPPERDVVEEISQSNVVNDAAAYHSSYVTEPANPSLASSLDPRPSLILAEERPDSLVLRGSFLSEGISDLADDEILSPPPIRQGLEDDHRSASAVEVSEPSTSQNEQEWTGTVRMRHDTLESNATYATLPSYRSMASAGALLEYAPAQLPPLSTLRPLPSAPLPRSDIGILRQISASTTRSYETVPSYRSY
ncbi:hypothetical protein BT96DRAFT_535616 [Gymnopus androsaceus JB14]|uniref:Uncharacterized protein n=1 Tax=Gymnopus androsaceus JB14 TaxID=1447944 RepID=A0A6A4I160_9AGAR|nr:hypothetical protein BT96DRAFT_535616 [Gymnopus androsaceus JB14]